MSERFSTGLRNFLMGEGSFRNAFPDSQIKVYSGTAPAEADDAIAGTLLLTITKSSGTVSSGERSTKNLWWFTILDSHASGATVIVNVTVDGVGPTAYTYTNTPDAGTAEQVLTKVAEMLDDIPQLSAIACTGAATRTVVVQARSGATGETITIADGGGTITITPTNQTAVARSDALSFGPPASGVISKAAAEVWSGVAAATGTAGYFRLVNSSDDGSDSSTAVRYQGVVATSGGELDVATVNLTAAATYTIDSFSITFPAE